MIFKKDGGILGRARNNFQLLAGDITAADVAEHQMPFNGF